MNARAKRQREDDDWPRSIFDWEVAKPHVPTDSEIAFKDSYGDVRVAGRIDAIDDRDYAFDQPLRRVLIDWKCTTRSAPECRYPRTWQWRLYLHARPDADMFEYHHFLVHPGDAAPPQRRWKIVDHEIVPLYRNDLLKGEIEAFIDEFRDFVQDLAETGQLKINAQGRIQTAKRGKR